MTLEQQVCSLELAKKLKELGIEQRSLWYWCKVNKKWSVEWGQSDEPIKATHYCSAFTVAELGEMLNRGFPNVFVSYREKLMGEQMYWVCIVRTALEPLKENDYQLANTEADTRAKMLIYLVENNLIQLQ